MNAEMLKEHLKANCTGRKNTVSGTSLERALHLSGNEQGHPTRAQRSGSRGERRSDGAGEFFAARRKRASAVRDDENRLRRKGIPIASSRDGKWGPRASPAKRVAWGEEERRSERAFGVSRKRGIRSPRRRYAATAGEVYSTIRQLRQMASGLDAAIGGLERALEGFGPADSGGDST